MSMDVVEAAGVATVIAVVLVWPYALIILPLNLFNWLSRRLDYDEVRRGYTRALMERLAAQSSKHE